MIDEPAGLRILEAALYGANELRALYEAIVLLGREKHGGRYPIPGYDDGLVVGV